MTLLELFGLWAGLSTGGIVGAAAAVCIIMRRER